MHEKEANAVQETREYPRVRHHPNPMRKQMKNKSINPTCFSDRRRICSFEGEREKTITLERKNETRKRGMIKQRLKILEIGELKGRWYNNEWFKVVKLHLV